MSCARKAITKRKASLFLLVLVLPVLWLLWPKTDKPEQRYDLVKVTQGDIEEVVTAQGKLEPKEFVDVGAQVSGQLLKLHVDIGDVVTKGDLIAEIDPKIYTAQVAADEARLKTLRAQRAEQQAQATYAAAVYTRNQMLYKQDAISKDGLEASEMEVKAARSRTASLDAQIEEAKSTLEGDKANLSYTTIYAPMDGTVVSQSAKEGQTLNANQTAPVIVQLANLDIMTVRAQVAEADVPRLSTGMPVYFTTLGSERRWQGNVRQLLPSPDATITDVILYNALIDVANEDRGLLTGMSAQVFFVLGQAQDVLTIPVRALGKKLGYDPEVKADDYEILIREGGKVITKTITVGYMDRSSAEVRAGLKAGDEVAIPKLEAAPASGAARPRTPRL